MTLTNLKIRDLISPDAKLTFLVGAGCSVDPPSSLVAGRKMIEDIVEYTCAESEIQKILDLEELRFEQLVEIVRNWLDTELKIIDYYGQCDKPNLQHFYLAEMIKKGHFVMTTNFDFLIEHALLDSGVSKKDIIPVITKEDFQNYKDPTKLYQKGKKTLYKVHGSTKNIISKEDTRDSLVATIQAFGSNKVGENVFQVEPFKRELFNNISNGRSLVIMGYSGSDDFDIVPTLKVLKNIQNIIWINYSGNKKVGKEEIHEINANTRQALDELDKNLRKVTQILLEIWQMNNAEHVYRVDVNTTEMAKSLLKSKPKLSSEDFSIKSRDWLENNLDVPSIIIKNFIPYRIYYDFDMYEDAMNCSEKILQIAKKTKDKSWESAALNNIGEIFRSQVNYPEALKRYEEALQICKKLGDLKGQSIRINNIGMIYDNQGNYQEALKRYVESLKIAGKLKDTKGGAIRLSNIGTIRYKQGNYSLALKRYEDALKIHEHLGNLRGKAIDLNNIGLIYQAQGNYPEALKRFEEALQIAEQLGDLRGKATHLNNIGLIFAEQGNYPEALKRYEEALHIDEKIGDLSGKATRLNNIGLIFAEQGNYPEALKRYEEALQVADQLGSLELKNSCFNNIGCIHQDQGNYPEALKWFEEALQIDGQLGDLSGKATRLNNIGLIFDEQGNFPEALKR